MSDHVSIEPRRNAVRWLYPRLFVPAILAFSLWNPSQVAAAYTSTVIGSVASMTGSGSAESINFEVSGGLIKHNRFTAGDAGFNSDFDFFTSIAGDQTLATGASTTIVVNGGAGPNDVLVLDESENDVYTNHIINSNSIVGRFTTEYSGMETVVVFPGAGFTHAIRSTASGVLTSVDTGGYGLEVGNASNSMANIQGLLFIQSSGYITLDDSGQTGAQTYTVSKYGDFETSFQRTGSAEVRVSALHIFLHAGSTSNTLNVTGANTAVTLAGGAGIDTYNFGNGNVLPAQQYPFSLYGAGGSDTLNVKNSASSAAQSYIAKDNILYVGGAEVLDWNEVETVNIATGSSSDNFTLTANFSGTTYNLDSGSFGQGDLLQVLQSSSPDSVNLAGNTLISTYGISPPQTTHFSDFDYLIVDSLGGNDAMTVQGLVNTEVLLNGNLPSASPGDTLSLVSSGSAYNLSGNTFTVPGRKPVHFSGFEMVTAEAQPHGPDLIGYSGLPAIKCKTGKTGLACSIKTTVHQLNIGDQPAVPTATQVYLSDDTAIDSGDSLLVTRVVKALAPGSYAAGKLSAKLPAGVDPNGKYLLIKLDANSQAAETWETNNVIVYGPIVH